jgi:hypothetical protein
MGRRRRSAVSYVVAFCSVVLTSVVLAASSAAALPNPCTLVANAHAGTAFGKGKSLALGAQKVQKYGTGKYAGATCLTSVGTQQLSLGVSGTASGGFGGVKVTSQTHPGGLGSGATLTVGTAAGSGSAVDFITFDRGGVYVDITANGGSPATLTSFARQVYKLLP